MIKDIRWNNGLRIAYEKMDSIESVAIGIWVGTGAIYERKEISGISHFLEHMMFKGTTNRSPLDIVSDIDKIGGKINAFTGKEATCYYVKVTKDHFEEAADVLVDMLENSIFNDEEIERERNVILEEMKMTLDDPADLAFEHSEELIFGDSSMANSIIGSKESLLNIKRAHFIDYVKSRYTKDNMVISIAGNVEEKRVVDFFEKCFSKFSEHCKGEPVFNGSVKSSPIIVNKEIEQSHIVFGLKIPRLEKKESYALRMLANIMGGGMSSRLFQSIREEKGLAYTVHSHYVYYDECGIFRIYAGVSHENVSTCIDEIIRQMQLLKDNGITEDELVIAREQYKADLIFSGENPASRAFVNGKSLLLENTVEEISKTRERIESIDLEFINSMIPYISNIDEYGLVIITGKDNDALEAYH